MKLENMIHKGKKGLLTLLASGILAGCAQKYYKIEPIAKADFNGDGIEEVVGYTKDPSLRIESYVLAIINGKNIIMENGNSYVSKDKINTIQPHAKFSENEYNIENVSVEDVNGDGLPDISYDITIGTKRHKVMYNQGNNNEGNAILKGEI